MYPFSEIEKKWQKHWKDAQVFKAEIDHSRPKYYILDMFPYPSGAGLHVGHPLGYIASDILTRYKRLKGFNVLHPMGYDAFGLPAEQYAIKTGQHPAVTTENNIKRYREQLDAIGLSFDWSKEIRTCDASYYKHTQSVFIDLYNHYFDDAKNKAIPISELEKSFAENGAENFSAKQWNEFSLEKKEAILQKFRLAYRSEVSVNWCAELGTVLANDEVKEGLSVRGGYPVVQKKMMQWCLRITKYAERLLQGLNDIDWPIPLKDMQSNWIGKSIGAEVNFAIEGSEQSLEVFTTRPDTLFGVSFMVIAPESDYVAELTTSAQKKEVENYLQETSKRSERERIAETKKVSGVFTGSFCIHPVTKEKIPVWIADYVLGGYGTGAIMAVPAHDARDYAFAKYFQLPIIPVIAGADFSEQSFDAKDGVLCNSDFLNGMKVKEAIKKMISWAQQKNIGQKKINYKLRDATFSRQRYWGEPFPVYYKNGLPVMMDKKDLPLELPKVDSYLPTETGEPPLARAQNWQTDEGYLIDTNTMPGFAGSCAYYLRYMDPNNSEELVSEQACEYWQNVDFYVGGSEHATGHLLYSRFWNHFLYDLGKVKKKEPFQKLINQGMIQGRSNFVYRVKGTQEYVSYGLKDKYDTTQIHVDVSIVKNDILDTEKFKKWMPEFKEATFILEDGQYLCGSTQEKMSKSLHNVVNPDYIIDEYGADTLRLYEMFLGPIEQSKPWNTSGIEGVSRFLNKVWKLCHDGEEFKVSEEGPKKEDLIILHTMLKKVETDLESFSLNTAVSAFMICVNDLLKSKTKVMARAIIRDFTIALSSFAPHLSQEIWEKLGEKSELSFASFPKVQEELLVVSDYSYPVSLNGKMKFLLDFPIDLSKKEIEVLAMGDLRVKDILEGKTVKKIIIVPGKIINFVV